MPELTKNFAVSTIATVPSPNTTGTSLIVASGTGSRFPTPPFNATIAPDDALATPANSEIVRVTGRSGDTLTIVRAQESSSARSVTAGDSIFAGITAKTLRDLEQHAYPSLLRMYIYGYSHTFGAGGTYDWNSNWVSRFGTMFGVTDARHWGAAGTQFSKNGSWPTASNWATVLQTIRGSTASEEPYADNRIPLAVFQSGLVDMAYTPDAQIEGYLDAMRSAISRLLSQGAVYENDNASVVHSSGANANKGDRNSSGSVREITANASTTTITCKPWVDTRTVALGFVADTGNEGTATITVNGTGVGAFNIGASAGINPESAAAPRIVRLNNVPGSATIVITYSNITTKVQFDYWQVECNAGHEPIAMVPQILKLNSYSLFSSNPFPPTNTRVDTWNAALVDMATEFPPDVVITPAMSGLFRTSDPLHPDYDGHTQMAEQAAAAMPVLTRTREAAVSAGVGAFWANIGFNAGYAAILLTRDTEAAETPAYRMYPDGRVELRGMVYKTLANWAAGDVIFQLPHMARPRVGARRVVETRVGSTLGTGLISVQQNGNVTYKGSQSGGTPQFGGTGFANSDHVALEGISFEAAHFAV